ncbi:Hypothetical predicted protein [Cloeon dipterum]|uniref:Uncharacterized protein n=1 Tax=Cloeon dipterum TaxID=197152 RepID=A0A8S1E5B1_9INSE|nr:Hypothetical predicted protein [Cloeon dipterum]
MFARRVNPDPDLGVTVATELGKLTTSLQFERTEIAYNIYTNGSSLRANLTQTFQKTLWAIANVTTWPIAEKVDGLAPENADVLTTAERFTEILLAFSAFSERLNNNLSVVSICRSNNFLSPRAQSSSRVALSRCTPVAIPRGLHGDPTWMIHGSHVETTWMVHVDSPEKMSARNT